MLRLLNRLFVSSCLLVLAFAGLCVLNYYSPTAGNALTLGIPYVAAIGLAAVLLASPVVLIRWVANRRGRSRLPTYQVKAIRLAPAATDPACLGRNRSPRSATPARGGLGRRRLAITSIAPLPLPAPVTPGSLGCGS